MPSLPSDLELAQRSARGDAEAFAGLVARHTPALFAYLRARCPALAEDLTQESFLRAWRGIRGFRGDCTWRAWLFGIARNLVIDTDRRRKRAVSSPEVLDLSGADDPVQQALLADEHQAVRTAVQSLPPADRELIELLYRHQLSYEEIATVLGLPLGTVKARLHRARRQVRGRLEQSWECERHG